jgi:hypothetical protein
MIGNQHLEVPDLIEPIIGFRIFGININGLVSPYQIEYVWKRDNEAKCDLGCFEVVRFDFSDKELVISTPPGKECDCGLYGYFNCPSAGHGVIGIVSCTGKIQVHSTGMRSQKMRIEALAADNKITREGLEKLDWIGDIPIFSKISQKMALEFGSPLPQSMRYNQKNENEEMF